MIAIDPEPRLDFAPVAADLDGDGFEVATALARLNPRLSVFPLCGPAAAPSSGWKRRRPAGSAGIASWAARYPGAQMAVRVGSSAGLIVVEADDAHALAEAEATWGTLPTTTVRSVCAKGRPAVWMGCNDVVLTARTRSLRIWANGSYFPLPSLDSGCWIVRPDRADFHPIPAGWISAAQALTAPPPTTVRFFPTVH